MKQACLLLPASTHTSVATHLYLPRVLQWQCLIFHFLFKYKLIQIPSALLKGCPPVAMVMAVDHGVMDDKGFYLNTLRTRDLFIGGITGWQECHSSGPLMCLWYETELLCCGPPYCYLICSQTWISRLTLNRTFDGVEKTLRVSHQSPNLCVRRQKGIKERLRDKNNTPSFLVICYFHYSISVLVLSWTLLVWHPPPLGPLPPHSWRTPNGGVKGAIRYVLKPATAIPDAVPPRVYASLPSICGLAIMWCPV